MAINKKKATRKKKTAAKAVAKKTKKKISPKAAENKRKYGNESYTPPKKTIKANKYTLDVIYSYQKQIVEDSNHPNREILEILIDIGMKGARLNIILANIYPIDFKSITGDIEKHNERVKAFGKRTRAITGAASQISKLKLLDWKNHPALGKDVRLVNKRLRSIQKTFDAGLIDLYLQYLEWSEFPIGCFVKEDGEIKIEQGMVHYNKQRVQLKEKDEFKWNKRIIAIVDELKSVGFSYKQSYTITGRLLSLSFPDHFKDDDPDIVKSRYQYNKSK